MENNDILNRRILVPKNPFLIEIKGGGDLEINNSNIEGMYTLLSYFIPKKYVTLAIYYIKKDNIKNIKTLKSYLEKEDIKFSYNNTLTMDITEHLTSGKIYMSTNTQIIEMLHNKKKVDSVGYDHIICSFDFKEELLKSLNKNGTLIIQSCKNSNYVKTFNNFAELFNVDPINADYEKVVNNLDYYGFVITKEYKIKNKGLNPLDVRIIIAKRKLA